MPRSVRAASGVSNAHRMPARARAPATGCRGYHRRDDGARAAQRGRVPGLPVRRVRGRPRRAGRPTGPPPPLLRRGRAGAARAGAPGGVLPLVRVPRLPDVPGLGPARGRARSRGRRRRPPTPTGARCRSPAPEPRSMRADDETADDRGRPVGAPRPERPIEDRPRRNPPRDWAAPPPWASGAAARRAPPGAARGAGGAAAGGGRGCRAAGPPTSWRAPERGRRAWPAAPPIGSPRGAAPSTRLAAEPLGRLPSATIRGPADPSSPVWSAAAAVGRRPRARAAGPAPTSPGPADRRVSSTRDRDRDANASSANGSANAGEPDGRRGSASGATRPIRRSRPGRRCRASRPAAGRRARAAPGHRGARRCSSCRRSSGSAAVTTTPTPTPSPSAAVATPTPDRRRSRRRRRRSTSSRRATRCRGSRASST